MRLFPSRFFVLLLSGGYVLLSLISARGDTETHADRSARIDKLLRDGQLADAEKAARAAVEEDVMILGAEDPLTLEDRLILARAQQALGDQIPAERECRAIMAIYAKKLGPENAKTI